MEKIKVLIPTDFSVQTEFAYLMVKNLSQNIAVEPHFLHVLSVPDTVSMDHNGNIQTCGEIDISYVEGQMEIAKRNLDTLKNTYGDVHTHLRLGAVTSTTVSFAQELNADLIVTGTKGAWGSKEFFSGSNAQMLVRHATKPVLSLMCDRSDLEIKNVLLLVQDDSSLNHDFQLLKLLSEKQDVTLHYLRIYSQKDSTDFEKFKLKMVDFSAENKIDSYQVHFFEAEDVEKGVVHFNEMKNMDLICLGTPDRKVFSDLGYEKIINHMFKPIITFK